MCVLYGGMHVACVCVCAAVGGSEGASLPKIKTWQ